MLKDDNKINRLVAVFAKNHNFFSQELCDGISVLERFNWNVKMAAIVVKLNLDHGSLITYKEVDYIDALMMEKLNKETRIELSSEEKISRIKDFFRSGYCSFDYNHLEKAILESGMD